MGPEKAARGKLPTDTWWHTIVPTTGAERTGYPTDMLDLNLDLAADLSIDSIKRIEIIGELCKRLGLGQGDMARRDEVIEELASQKTLKNILTWLEKQKEKATPQQESAPAEKTEVQESLNRYVLSVEHAPVLSRNGHNTEGKTFALTDDGLGVAKAAQIKAALELGKRLMVASPEERPQVKSPADVANLLMLEMGFLEQEHLRVVLLDSDGGDTGTLEG